MSLRTHWRRTAFTTTKQLTEWLKAAIPGSSAIYYVGLLGADREGVVGTRRVFYPPHERGLTAWKAHDKGEVELTQRRISPGIFQYIITKRFERNTA